MDEFEMMNENKKIQENKAKRDKEAFETKRNSNIHVYLDTDYTFNTR